jgi:hypothetical protein
VSAEASVYLDGARSLGQSRRHQAGSERAYSDINNTAMLIEIARKQKDYVPEPSFGTHFFQDLVEASIYYLPLYPDDADIVFNECFLTSQPNILADIMPVYDHFAEVIRVIDVPASTEGQFLQVLMKRIRSGQSDLNESIRVLKGKQRFDNHLPTQFFSLKITIHTNGCHISGFVMEGYYFLCNFHFLLPFSMKSSCLSCYIFSERFHIRASAELNT